MDKKPTPPRPAVENPASRNPAAQNPARQNAHAPKGAAQKRILIVSQHFWPETFRITDIAAGFVEAGVAVDVLCGLPNYPSGEWFRGYRYRGPRRENYKGAALYRAGEIRRKGNTPLRIFLNYTSFPLLALFSLPRLARRRYDAVFCYETSPVLMMLPAVVYAKSHHIPLTTYVLDLWPDNLYSVLPVKNKTLRAVAQHVSDWFYRRSDRLIAMSDGLAQRLTEVTHAAKRPPRMAVIPQYCEDFFAQDLPDPALQVQHAGHFTVLFAGNISPAQDLENLVQAAALAKASGAEHVRYLIVGDGMSLADIQGAVQQAGLDKDFVFYGRCPAEEIPRYTTAADALFAGLAKSENLGLTVPAKMSSCFAAGKPILAAADGEAARVAAESGAALTSPAGDAAALADNIVKLAGMPAAERGAMGAAGRRCYEEHYRRDRLLQQLLHFILAE